MIELVAYIGGYVGPKLHYTRTYGPDESPRIHPASAENGHSRAYAQLFGMISYKLYTMKIENLKNKLQLNQKSSTSDGTEEEMS